MPATDPTTRARLGTALGTAAGVGLAAIAVLAATRPDPVIAEAVAEAASAGNGSTPATDAPPPQHSAEPEAPADPGPSGVAMPAYPGAKSVPMGQFGVNGNATEMRVFVTPDSPEQVLAFYEDAFVSEGKHVERHGEGAVRMVSYYDDRSGNLISLMTMRDRSDAVTLAYPAVTDVSAGLEIGNPPPAELPAPPGASVILSLDDAQGRHSHTYTQMQHGMPPEVAKFYREQMAQRGFKVTEDKPGAHTTLLAFEGHGKRVQVSLSPLAEWNDPPESMAAIIVEEAQ